MSWTGQSYDLYKFQFLPHSTQFIYFLLSRCIPLEFCTLNLGTCWEYLFVGSWVGLFGDVFGLDGCLFWFLLCRFPFPRMSRYILVPSIAWIAAMNYWFIWKSGVNFQTLHFVKKSRSLSSYFCSLSHFNSYLLNSVSSSGYSSPSSKASTSAIVIWTVGWFFFCLFMAADTSWYCTHNDLSLLFLPGIWSCLPLEIPDLEGIREVRNSFQASSSNGLPREYISSFYISWSLAIMAVPVSPAVLSW